MLDASQMRLTIFILLISFFVFEPEEAYLHHARKTFTNTKTRQRVIIGEGMRTIT